MIAGNHFSPKNIHLSKSKEDIPKGAAFEASDAFSHFSGAVLRTHCWLAFLETVLIVKRSVM
jgi:hypothetical protein